MAPRATGIGALWCCCRRRPAPRPLRPRLLRHRPRPPQPCPPPPQRREPPDFANFGSGRAARRPAASGQPLTPRGAPRDSAPLRAGPPRLAASPGARRRAPRSAPLGRRRRSALRAPAGPRHPAPPPAPTAGNKEPAAGTRRFGQRDSFAPAARARPAGGRGARKAHGRWGRRERLPPRPDGPGRRAGLCGCFSRRRRPSRAPCTRYPAGHGRFPRVTPHATRAPSSLLTSGLRLHVLAAPPDPAGGHTPGGGPSSGRGSLTQVLRGGEPGGAYPGRGNPLSPRGAAGGAVTASRTPGSGKRPAPPLLPQVESWSWAKTIQFCPLSKDLFSFNRDGDVRPAMLTRFTMPFRSSLLDVWLALCTEDHRGREIG